MPESMAQGVIFGKHFRPLDSVLTPRCCYRANESPTFTWGFGGQAFISWWTM
jgi:hypothetical protein